MMISTLTSSLFSSKVSMIHVVALVVVLLLVLGSTIKSKHDHNKHRQSHQPSKLRTVSSRIEAMSKEYIAFTPTVIPTTTPMTLPPVLPLPPIPASPPMTLEDQRITAYMLSSSSVQDHNQHSSGPRRYGAAASATTTTRRSSVRLLDRMDTSSDGTVTAIDANSNNTESASTSIEASDTVNRTTAATTTAGISEIGRMLFGDLLSSNDYLAWEERFQHKYCHKVPTDTPTTTTTPFHASIDEPFFFFHLPKTGGTSLRDFLFRHYVLLQQQPSPPPLSVQSNDAIAVSNSSSGGKSVVSSLISQSKNIKTKKSKSKTQSLRVLKAKVKSNTIVRDTTASSYQQLHTIQNNNNNNSNTFSPSYEIAMFTRPSASSTTSHHTYDGILAPCYNVDCAFNMTSPVPPPPVSPLLSPSPRSLVSPAEKEKVELEMAKINASSCTKVFLGHFYPYEVLSNLVRIQIGLIPPSPPPPPPVSPVSNNNSDNSRNDSVMLLPSKQIPFCQRWQSLLSSSTATRDSNSNSLLPLATRDFTGQDPLYWQIMQQTRCITVVRNPFQRAISGYYEFGYPLTNLTLTEYLNRYSVLEFLYISSSYVNAQTAILGGEKEPEFVNRTTLRHAQRMLHECITGIQEDMMSFVQTLSLAFSLPLSVSSNRHSHAQGHAQGQGHGHTVDRLGHYNSLKEKAIGNPALQAERLTFNATHFRELVRPYLSLDYELWLYAKEVVIKRQRELLMSAKIKKENK